MMPSLGGVLFGRNARLSATLFGATIGLTLLAQYAYRFHPDRTIIGIVSVPELLLVPMFVPALVHASLNRGLVPCVAYGALAGFCQNAYLYVYDVDPPYRSGPGHLAAVGTELQLPAIGIEVGAFAFVIGASLGLAVRTARSFAPPNGAS